MFFLKMFCELNTELMHNKRKQSDLGELSPFLQKAAKVPPPHPIRCCGRYISEISKNGENMKFMKTILLSTTLACSGLVQAGDKDVKEELLNKLTFLYSCKAEAMIFNALIRKA
jgi:hypothetical protein